MIQNNVNLENRFAYPFDRSALFRLEALGWTEFNLLADVAELKDLTTTLTIYIAEYIKFGVWVLCDRVEYLFELFHLFECITINKLT